MDVIFKRKTRLPFTLMVFTCAWAMTSAIKQRTYVRERLSPPLDIELQTINCSAVQVRWRIPWRHVSTVTGYKVFYTVMRNGRPASSALAVNVPLSLDVLAAVKFDGQTAVDVEVGSLRPGTQHVFSVGAYGWAGEGRPSVPRRIRTFAPEICMSPAVPSQPRVVSVSDTEIKLSWQPAEREGVPSALGFLVSHIRPGVDSDWTSVEDSVASSSVVVPGLDPDTQYQFAVQAVNSFGISPPSTISDPAWTLSSQNEGSGIVGLGYPGNHNLSEEEASDVHGLRHNVPLRETFIYSKETSRRSQLSSKTHISDAGGEEENISSREVRKTTTPSRTTVTGPILLASSPHPDKVSLVSTPPSNSTTSPSSPPSPLLPRPPPPPASAGGWRRGLHDLTCEDTVCPAHSVCVDDFQSGGSRCYCALGLGGEACSEVVMASYPKFHGFSHIAFEPLKKSYHTLQITLDFKADSDSGLLLFCGESDQGEGDYASLALIHGRLHFRFNCGTGSGHMVSGRRVTLGRWHTVSVARVGVTGWLRMDNDKPVTGSSQGDYTKITFRTPLYVGGSPNVYWLIRTTGTNRGFQGCIQMLSINNRMMDMRPWPIGSALSGADVGVCSASVCADVSCAHGGTCVTCSTDGYLCLCPLGFRGRRCQDSFLLVVPLFRASVRSYASAPWPGGPRHYLSFQELEVVFLPGAPDGTLLYSQDTDTRDFLSVTLAGGHPELRFDCGSGTAVIRSEAPVSLNEWHELRAWRTGRAGILQVDTQRPSHGLAEGAFTQIRCGGPLFIGGVPDHSSTQSQAGLIQPFTGSIQKISVNGQSLRLPQDLSAGVNLDNSLHPCMGNPCLNAGWCRPRGPGYKCDCPLGYAGKHCQQECGTYGMNFTEPVALPQFIGRSYLTYDKKDILRRVSGYSTSVFLRFRSFSQDGLLLWRGHMPLRVNTDFMSLSLKSGALLFSYNLGSGVATLMVNGSFSDGQWHWVKAVREGQVGTLTVDQSESSTGRSPGNMRQLNTNTDLFLGGVKERVVDAQGVYMWGLMGCVSHLSLSPTHHLSLLEDAARGRNVHTCGT
ncbi:pikachurin [Osmerus mordax]|uniref:pikachurin n=1 Tax=Osmerus mordax TaxID=8014 RepID=UPI003510B1E5